jgi:hypothetical protein
MNSSKEEEKMKDADPKRTPSAFIKCVQVDQLRLVLRDCALKALEKVYDPAADLRTLATQMRDTAGLVVAELGSPPSIDGRENIGATRRPPAHVHTRECYEDPGPGHGSPFLVCDKLDARQLAELDTHVAGTVWRGTAAESGVA